MARNTFETYASIGVPTYSYEHGSRGMAPRANGLDVTQVSISPHTGFFVVNTMRPTETGGASWPGPGAQRTIGFVASNAPADVRVDITTDDEVVIMYLNQQRTRIYHIRLAADLTGGSWQLAYQVASPSTIEAWDMSVSATKCVALAAFVYNGSNQQTRSFSWRNPAGAWYEGVSIGGVVVAGISRGAVAVAVKCLDNPTSTIRDVATAWSHGRPSSGDQGVDITTLRVTEATGIVTVGSFTSRQILMTGEADPGASVPRGGRYLAIFRDRTNEATLPGKYTVVMAHREKTRKLGVVRHRLYGGTFAVIQNLSTTNISGGALNQLCSSSNGRGDIINVYYHRNNYTAAAHIGNTLVKLDAGGSTSIDFSVSHYFERSAFGTLRGNIGQAQGWHINHKLQTMMFMQHSGASLSANTFCWAAIPMPTGAGPIKSHEPAPGQNVTSATPKLAATIDFELPQGQSNYRLRVQAATDSAFTTNLRDYLQPLSKFVGIIGTDSNNGIVVTDTWPATHALAGGSWFMRFRLEDEFGNASAWKTPTANIIVGHPPVAVPTSPTAGELYFYGEGYVDYIWNFTDPSPTDYQTAAQVQVFDHLGNTLTDTGKMSSFPWPGWQGPLIDPAYKDYNLSWRVRLWDSEDTMGNWSPTRYFALTDPPTASISQPTPGQALATGVPTIVAGLITSGTRRIREYTLTVTQGGIPIWSHRVTGDFASPYTANIKMPQGYLKNGESYSVQAFVRDSSNLSSISSVVPFSVSWVLPDAPNGVGVDTSQYNVEGAGYNTVTWSGSNMETANFAGWAVYRYVYEPILGGGYVDPNPEPKLVHVEYSRAVDYSWRDYFAPAGVHVRYGVSQMVNRNEQDIESNTSINGEHKALFADGYWLVSYDPETEVTDATRLSIVTGDDFSSEQEESEMVVIGRGRVFQKGQKLGVRGTLAAQLRNTHGSTARQKRQRLVALQESNGDLYLRNPFGDTYKVNVSSISVSRVAGVGADEFVDVSIPYTEVAE